VAGGDKAAVRDQKHATRAEFLRQLARLLHASRAEHQPRARLMVERGERWEGRFGLHVPLQTADCIVLFNLKKGRAYSDTATTRTAAWKRRSPHRLVRSALLPAPPVWKPALLAQCPEVPQRDVLFPASFDF
jgi:hypothetical protein